MLVFRVWYRQIQGLKRMHGSLSHTPLAVAWCHLTLSYSHSSFPPGLSVCRLYRRPPLTHKESFAQQSPNCLCGCHASCWFQGQSEREKKIIQRHLLIKKRKEKKPVSLCSVTLWILFSLSKVIVLSSRKELHHDLNWVLKQRILVPGIAAKHCLFFVIITNQQIPMSQQQ